MPREKTHQTQWITEVDQKEYEMSPENKLKTQKSDLNDREFKNEVLNKPNEIKENSEK